MADPPIKGRSWHQQSELWDGTNTVIWLNGLGAESASISNPPFGLRAWMPAVLDQWIEPQPHPVKHNRLTESASVDSPTFGIRPWLKVALDSWVEPQPAPVTRRHIAESAPPVIPEDPPFGNRLWSQPFGRWVPTHTLIWLNGQGSEEAAFVSDNPPVKNVKWLHTALNSWVEVQPDPVIRRFVTESGAPFSPEDPPFGNRSQSQTIVNLWDETLIPLWGSGQATFDAPDDPPFGLPNPSWAVVRVSWEPMPEPQQPQRLQNVPTGAQVDSPTFGLRPWLSALDSWVDPQPSRVDFRKVTESAAPVVPDDPPFNQRTWLAREIKSWEPQDAQVTQRIAYAPIPDPVAPDNPPLTSKPWLPHQIEQWKEREVGRQKRRTLAQGIILDNPPIKNIDWFNVTLDSWARLEGWQTPQPAWRVTDSFAGLTVISGPRTYVVDAEDRVYVVDAEDRVYVVGAEDRTASI